MSPGNSRIAYPRGATGKEVVKALDFDKRIVSALEAVYCATVIVGAMPSFRECRYNQLHRALSAAGSLHGIGQLVRALRFQHVAAAARSSARPK